MWLKKIALRGLQGNLHKHLCICDGDKNLLKVGKKQQNPKDDVTSNYTNRIILELKNYTQIS